MYFFMPIYTWLNLCILTNMKKLIYTNTYEWLNTAYMTSWYLCLRCNTMLIWYLLVTSSFCLYSCRPWLSQKCFWQTICSGKKICQKSKLRSGREAFHETHLNEGALVLLFFMFCPGLCEFLNHVNLTMLCLAQPWQTQQIAYPVEECLRPCSWHHSAVLPCVRGIAVCLELSNFDFATPHWLH